MILAKYSLEINMPKQRTKKDKVKASKHRTIGLKTTNVPKLPMQKLAQVNKEQNVTESKIGRLAPQRSSDESLYLLGYDIKHLYKDLVRSLAITSLLIVLLACLYVLLRYQSILPFSW